MASQSQEILQTSTQQNNPLTRKLKKILNTRLDNDKVIIFFKNLSVKLDWTLAQFFCKQH